MLFEADAFANTRTGRAHYDTNGAPSQIYGPAALASTRYGRARQYSAQPHALIYIYFYIPLPPDPQLCLRVMAARQLRTARLSGLRRGDARPPPPDSPSLPARLPISRPAPAFLGVLGFLGTFSFPHLGLLLYILDFFNFSSSRRLRCSSNFFTFPRIYYYEALLFSFKTPRGFLELLNLNRVSAHSPRPTSTPPPAFPDARPAPLFLLSKRRPSLAGTSMPNRRPS